MMNILSIDWDYFFPDNFAFDWQMNEEKFFYYEMLWPIRWSNRDLYNPDKMAKDIYHPDQQLMNGFWNKVLSNSDPIFLTIADSHTNIEHLINLFPAKVNIYNFDQHHDIYYYDDIPSNMQLNCGNWIAYFRKQINEYHLIYPPWRKNHPEHNDNQLSFTKSVSYHIPDSLPDFQMVFICRSSPWTPSWADHHWIEFIEYFKTNYPILWKRKSYSDYVLKARPFNQAEAEEYYQQSIKMMKQLKEKQ